MLPSTITVITSADLRQQPAITPDLLQAIGNLLPSFAPSTQKLSARPVPCDWHTHLLARKTGKQLPGAIG